MGLIRLFALGAVACATVQGTANAQYAISGGNATCEDLEDAGAFYTNHPNMQWIFGFLSGAATLGMALNNASETQLTRALDGMTNDEIVEWVEDWCSSNGSQTLSRAASRFIYVHTIGS